MARYYGIFEVCIDRRQARSLQIKKLRLVRSLLDNPGQTFSARARKVYESRDNAELRLCLQALRRSEQEENRLRLSQRFETRYFIHETDELGWLLPSKKETREAMALP